jgi:hypothetical protein
MCLPCSSLPSLQRLELWPRLKLISSEVLAVSVSPMKLREICEDLILKVKAYRSVTKKRYQECGRYISINAVSIYQELLSRKMQTK